MQAINYVKRTKGAEVQELTASGVKLANMAIAQYGGLRGTKSRLKEMGVTISESTIVRISNNGAKGPFFYNSWEKFFNALILEQTAA
ncbi:hypothetical protein JST56_07100 [Candidatus Dependentiae bacterium]|nr:hypothetical protein [Candidatus Dependentiae bacterium]